MRHQYMSRQLMFKWTTKCFDEKTATSKWLNSWTKGRTGSLPAKVARAGQLRAASQHASHPTLRASLKRHIENNVFKNNNLPSPNVGAVSATRRRQHRINNSILRQRRTCTSQKSFPNLRFYSQDRPLSFILLYLRSTSGWQNDASTAPPRLANNNVNCGHQVRFIIFNETILNCLHQLHTKCLVCVL